MIAYIIAGHGDFAESIMNSSFMIFGKQEEVQAINFQPNEDPEELEAQYKKSVADFSSEYQIVFLVDLYGGTPFNVATQIVAENAGRMTLIAGLNLPMLVEAYTVRDQSIDTVVNHLEKTAKAGVRHLEIQDGDK